MDGRWTEVRHKKKSTVTKDNDAITYFVSNVPKNVRREETWSTFQRYGVVSDVFYPWKKGKKGQFSHIVRFKGVENKYELEKGINDIMYKGKE